jgi:methionyl-tRNA formyltransferase
VGVVTQPDKTVGRSRSKLEPPPVKRAAMEDMVPVLQPERPRGEAFLAELREMDPDISVVVAYGHLLPKDVIELPKHGTLNIHASLLPQLRGAAPIQAAIREGHARTGVSIMRMVQKLDAGPVIFQLSTSISEDETYGELALRLSELGATALIQSLTLLELGGGRAPEEPQDESRATYAPKIERDTTRVDWTTDAHSVARTIRAYDPRPSAFTTLNGQNVKLYGARLAPRTEAVEPATVVSVDEDGLVVACGEGAVRVQQVQPSGKKRMSAVDWARGRGVQVGDRFDVEG